MNIKLYQRIIKLIAMTYAIDPSVLWKEYQKIGSIDKILKKIKNDEIDDYSH